MKRLFKNWRLPDNLDILFLLVFGILLQMTDGSPFTMKDRWMVVWDTELPVENFSQFAEKVIKTVLSMIVVIRCVTSFAYVVSAMLVIFSLLKDYAPKLMLPWLLIGGIKSVLLTFVEALAGVYVCSAFGQIRKACIEFVISKALEIIFASYLWGSILNIYQEMERKEEEKKKPEVWEQLFMQKGVPGRQRARSMLDESTLYKTACLNNFEFKDVPQIILQMLRRGDEMSNDSLLDPGMMLASVSNMGSFDNLKTSQSLGELGFVDLRHAQVVGLEDDEFLPPKDKALKFLKLTRSDITRAQRNKTALGSDIHRIDKDTWRQVIDNGTHINKPNRARAEVFIREIQQVDPEDEARKSRKRSFDLKFSWSFLNLYSGKQVLSPEIDDEQESLVYREDEDEEEEGREDDEPTPLFMSNIRDEAVVNRISLGFTSKKMKGDAYAQLYKQDYMSVIGPEVFEKATRLKKITSLSRINRKTDRNADAISSGIYPLFSETALTEKKKISFSETSRLRIQPSSSEHNRNFDTPKPDSITHSENPDSEKKSPENVIASREETDSAEDKPKVEEPFHLESDKISDENSENPKTPETKKESSDEHSQIIEKPEMETLCSTPSSSELPDVTEEPPKYYRKRRIKITRIRKQETKPVASSQDVSENTEKISEPQVLDLEFVEEEKPETQKSECSLKTLMRKPSNDGRSFNPRRGRQTYFVSDVIQHTLVNFLNYLDKKTNPIKKPELRFLKRKEKYRGLKANTSETCDSDWEDHQETIWKSDVLKSVETYLRYKNPTSDLNLTGKCLSRELLQYYIQKNYLLETEKDILLSLCFANGAGLTTSSSETLFSESRSESSVPPPEIREIENLKQNDLDDSKAAEPETTAHFATPEIPEIDFICKKSKLSLEDESNLKVSSDPGSHKSGSDFEKVEIKEENLHLELDSRIAKPPVDEESICSQESDEPISLYYSKAANLASPLLDVKRFIYPDHIHYSYKHVKKKGFDVDISGGFPLLVRESLTMSAPLTDSLSTHPAITRRPMDLSFATTNAFAEWQTNEQNDVDCIFSETKNIKSHPRIDIATNRKEDKADVMENKRKSSKNSSDSGYNRFPFKSESSKTKPFYIRNLKDFRHFYSSKDYLLIEKLVKMHLQFNSKEYTDRRNSESERTPIQISSTQLHSNKGRISSTYNPAIFLQENKTRNEKKKVETQEERTKDMFARLEREALLQSRNVQRSTGQFVGFKRK